MVKTTTAHSSNALDVATGSNTGNASRISRQNRMRIRSSKPNQTLRRANTEQLKKRGPGRPRLHTPADAISDLDHRPWLSERYLTVSESPTSTNQEGKRDAAKKARFLRKALCVRKKQLRNTESSDRKGKKKAELNDKWEIVACPSCQALLWSAEAVGGQSSSVVDQSPTIANSATRITKSKEINTVIS